MSSFTSQDTGGNQLFLPSTTNITDISLISIYWSDILGKPSFCNVAITANYNDLINLPSISSSSVVFNGDYNSLSNLPWTNNNSNIYFIRNGNVGIGTTNPNNKLHLIGNFSIEGNIIPTINSNFDLGSSNFKWKDLYLSGNSIYLDNLILSKNSSNNLEIKDSNGNFKNLNINSIELNNLNNKVILTLSNQQLIFNSNGTIFNSINFNNYSNIIYSNVLSNTSNSIINYINTSINNINIPNTDTIIIGTSNRFITSNTFSNNLTITSNLFINGNYYLKNQLLPFSITSNTSITTSNGLFNYINNCNFGYYTFLTNGSITFPQTTSCDILVVGAGGNGGLGILSGGGGAGEVISYPNYTFNQGTYNIKVGNASLNSNDKISSIRSNNISILAQGGGIGASLLYSNLSNTLSNIYIYNNASVIVNNFNASNINNLQVGFYNILFNNKDNIALSNITNSINYNISNLTFVDVNPTAWYRLDNNGNDSSGNGYNLTTVGTLNYDNSDFQQGTHCVSFNGSAANYFKLDTGNLIDINAKSFSITFWVRPTIVNESGQYIWIFNIGTQALANQRLHVAVAGDAIRFNDNGSGDLAITSMTPNIAGRWNHIGLVYNHSSGLRQIYLNGVVVASKVQIAGLGGDKKFYLGGINAGGYPGKIDDFRIYSGTVLNSEQINNICKNSVNIVINPDINGGGTSTIYNNSNGSIISNKWDNNFSYITNGSNGTLTKGGNGGSALSNIGFTSLITGNSLIVGEGGNGATTTSFPILDQTYGSGGDGNGGLGTQGIIIIRTPLDIIKSSFDGYINYSNVINRPILNDLFATNNFINFGFNNQVNFPLADVSWANEWFLYIGVSPTSIPNSFIFWHTTSTINSKWWFNGTTATTNAEISDCRIKKEITNIENPLDKLMALQPKEYYLCDEKDYLRKYGILAQDVNSNQDLKHLVYKDEEYIANIYTNANYNNKIITTEIPIRDKIEINDELKILIDNNNENKEIIIEDLPYHNRYKKRYVKIKEILNDYSFSIYDEIEIMEKEKNKIFIYGKKVEDFLKLDYSSLYSLNIACTQELYKIIQEQTIIIENLKNRIEILEK